MKMASRNVKGIESGLWPRPQALFVPNLTSKKL